MPASVSYASTIFRWLVILLCVSLAETHFCCSSHPCRIAQVDTARENAILITFSCSAHPAAFASLTFARNASAKSLYLCVKVPADASLLKVIFLSCTVKSIES